MKSIKKINQILKSCNVKKNERKEFLNWLEGLTLNELIKTCFIRSYCELNCCCDSYKLNGIKEVKTFLYQTILANTLYDLITIKEKQNFDLDMENFDFLENKFKEVFEKDFK